MKGSSITPQELLFTNVYNNSRGNALISLGRRNRTDSMGRLGEDGDGNRKGLVEEEMETVLGEMTRIGEYFEKKKLQPIKGRYLPQNI